MWVYVIHNKTANRLYIGQTSNLNRRLVEHNLKQGKHFTAQFEGEWELIYSESVPTRSEALRREKQLKSFQGREFLKKFIEP